MGLLCLTDRKNKNLRISLKKLKKKRIEKYVNGKKKKHESHAESPSSSKTTKIVEPQEEEPVIMDLFSALNMELPPHLREMPDVETNQNLNEKVELQNDEEEKIT